ncbi:MAG: ATP-dependent DNA helicase, partial [Rhodospirillales bacterium]|nr:ATP-dependent DNA helicase [Rhodospirillales bacterium]
MPRPDAGAPPRLILPDAPAVVAGIGRAVILTTDGEVLDLPADAAGRALRGMAPPLLVHAPATLRRLGLAGAAALDLLELFAFVLPARPVVPTPRGLALALDAPPPADPEAACLALPDLARTLLARLAAGRETPLHRDAAALAARMGRAGWGWAASILAALGGGAATAPDNASLRVWHRLPEWEETAPPPPPAAHEVQPQEARARLAAMLGPDAEQRPGQADYAAAVAAAFAARVQTGAPHAVLAEAGTGTGKTLGYIAPASLWAERNGSAVWVSTFTRHLQRQIDAELARLYPDPEQRRRRVVVRKGRENYLCLLNYEDAVNSAGGGFGVAGVVPLGLVARWVLATADGDLQGGDLPGWFAELFGAGLLAGLADRRGECLYSACAHFRRCFVEHTIRRARAADLVVANHALVMAQAVWGGIDDATVPLRYVFDEGHHLFAAADSAFSDELSGAETAELRRWLLGAEGGRSRARGLRRRIEDLVADRPDLTAPMEAALQAARALPGIGWATRLIDPGPELAGVEPGRPNPTEAVLRLLRRQVLARQSDDAAAGPFSLECDLHPVLPELPEAAATLGRALARLAAPLATLAERLAARLTDEAATLEEAERNRIEAVCRSLRRRALDPLAGWQAMLRTVASAPAEPGVRPAHVLFLRLDRRDGGPRGTEADVGLHRHWLDPTVPFATTLARPAHGLLVTSATLRDAGADDPERAWAAAEEHA